MFERLSDAGRSALRPIRMMNLLAIKNAAKHPIQSNALMSDRETYIIYLKSTDTRVIGAIRFSNIVFVPELQKGWIILPDTSQIYAGKPAYLCDPDIPYTLGINSSNYVRDLNDEVTPQLRKDLGLPKNLLKLHTDTLGQLCISKWNTSFDEAGGSIMVFIFGGLAGAVFMVMILISFLTIGGVFT